jgi:hypothetical protein
LLGASSQVDIFFDLVALVAHVIMANAGIPDKFIFLDPEPTQAWKGLSKGSF